MAINIFQTKISLFSSFSSASFFFSIFCSCLSVKSLITRCTVIFLCSFSVIARGKRFLFVLYVNTWQPNQRTYTFNLLKEKVYSKQRNSSANFMCFFAANIEICCEIKIVKKKCDCIDGNKQKCPIFGHAEELSILYFFLLNCWHSKYILDLIVFSQNTPDPESRKKLKSKSKENKYNAFDIFKSIHFNTSRTACSKKRKINLPAYGTVYVYGCISRKYRKSLIPFLKSKQTKENKTKYRLVPKHNIHEFLNIQFNQNITGLLEKC